MKTPELQPEANLKSLEQEVALTKEEITKFQKLKPKEQEKQKQERLAKLLELQNKLEQAVADGAKAGNFEEAKRLKEEIEKEIADLEQVVDVKLSIENLREIYTSFLRETWKKCGVNIDQINNAAIEPAVVDLKTEDYQARIADISASKFGEFTINPDTQNIDWEVMKDKIFIPDLSAFNGRPFIEVFKYLIDTYSDKYKLPGIEYWKFILENPDKVPDQLKNGRWYYNFGSLIRVCDGRWGVPYAFWFQSGWGRDTSWLIIDWDSYDRVILLEK